MKKLIIFAMLGFVFLNGCAITDGTKIADSQVNSIKEGVTTKNDIRRIFGEPSNVTKSSGNSETWMYRYTEYDYIPLVRGGTRSGNRSQMLMIMFNADKVSSYRFTKL